MPVRRISRSQAVLAVFVVAAVLCSVYVLALGPHTAASTEGAPQVSSQPPQLFLGEAIARVVDATGSVTVVRPPQGEERYTRYLSPVSEGLALFPGDQVWTGADSWVELDFGDEVRVRIDPRTRAEVVSGLLPMPGEPPGQDRPNLRLYLGDVWASVVSLVSRFANFSIETPTAIAGVRGTLFSVSVDVLGTTSVSVNEGIVAVSTFEEWSAEVLVASGEFTNVIAGRRPDVPRSISPDLEREWNIRSDWVLAHFERKEAYERRMALAQMETAPGPTPPPAAPAEGTALTTFDVAVSEPEPYDESSTDDPSYDEPPSQQPARQPASIGLASFGPVEAPAEEKSEDEDEEEAEEDVTDDEDAGDEDAGDEEADDVASGDEGDQSGAVGDGSSEGSGSTGSSESAEGGSRGPGPRSNADADFPTERSQARGGEDDEALRLVAEELETVREKIAERLVEAGVELDRLWADLESAVYRELDQFGERIARRLDD